jgi:hypothetical protein
VIARRGVSPSVYNNSLVLIIFLNIYYSFKELYINGIAKSIVFVIILPILLINAGATAT